MVCHVRPTTQQSALEGIHFARRIVIGRSSVAAMSFRQDEHLLSLKTLNSIGFDRNFQIESGRSETDLSSWGYSLQDADGDALRSCDSQYLSIRLQSR